MARKINRPLGGYPLFRIRDPSTRAPSLRFESALTNTSSLKRHPLLTYKGAIYKRNKLCTLLGRVSFRHTRARARAPTETRDTSKRCTKIVATLKLSSLHFAYEITLRKIYIFLARKNWTRVGRSHLIIAVNLYYFHKLHFHHTCEIFKKLALKN